jgi:hypothetical protein
MVKKRIAIGGGLKEIQVLNILRSHRLYPLLSAHNDLLVKAAINNAKEKFILSSFL